MEFFEKVVAGIGGRWVLGLGDLGLGDLGTAVVFTIILSLGFILIIDESEFGVPLLPPLWFPDVDLRVAVQTNLVVPICFHFEDFDVADLGSRVHAPVGEWGGIA